MVKRIIIMLSLVALWSCTSREKPENIGEFRALYNHFWKVVPKDSYAENIGIDFEFTEGPSWHPEGYLIFSDIPANRIYWWDGLKFYVFREPSRHTNGLLVTDEGKVIACEHGSRSVTIASPEDSVIARIGHYRGKRFNSPNDLCMARDGSIYFTDPPYGLPGLNNDPEKEIPFNGVYRWHEGIVSLVDSTLSWPNGIALSPDQQYLYVANTETERVDGEDRLNEFWMRYRLGNNGEVVERKVFFTAPDPSLPGGPDGMAVDEDGYLFVTGPGGILVLDPEGKHLGTITLPLIPSNLAFGPKGKELFVTARTNVFRIVLS
jgi:gluconolactonase